MELNEKWYHHAKGAGSNKWFSPVIHVVDWQNNGENIKRSVMEKYPYLNGKANWVVKNEDYYFKSGLSFSFVSTNGLAVRTLPKNCIFDVGASSIFPNREDQYFLLGYLNSGIVNAFISSINPTVNFQVGDLKRIPVVSFSNHQKEKLGELAQYCHQKAKQFYELTNPTASYIDIKYNNLSHV